MPNRRPLPQDDELMDDPGAMVPRPGPPLPGPGAGPPAMGPGGGPPTPGPLPAPPPPREDLAPQGLEPLPGEGEDTLKATVLVVADIGPITLAEEYADLTVEEVQQLLAEDKLTVAGNVLIWTGLGPKGKEGEIVAYLQVPQDEELEEGMEEEDYLPEEPTAAPMIF